MAKNKNKMDTSTKQVVKAIFIGVSVVFFWRGAWGLMDLYLFPNDLALSYALSLLIGVGVLLTTHYIVKELM